MLACAGCGFAWNAAFDSSLNLYDPAYDNDQTQSQCFRIHNAAMVHKILKNLPQNHALHLLDVGCGQGDFLTQLAQSSRNRFASLTGFDPAWRGNTTNFVQIHNRYFDATRASNLPNPIDAVVSRHTIEHVPDPLLFLRDIRTCMSPNPDARLFLETPDIEWILQNFQFQDLFYEHCSLFSKHAIEHALLATGFEPLCIERVFGEQYLWVEARPATPTNLSKDLGTTNNFLSRAKKFREHRQTILANWQDLIHAEAKDIWLWGASSKGVTFALSVDPDGATLKGAIDINTKKSGNFMPMTGLPIVTPHALKNGTAIIIMNPNYRPEIELQLEEMGITVEIMTGNI